MITLWLQERKCGSNFSEVLATVAKTFFILPPTLQAYEQSNNTDVSFAVTS